MSGSLFDLIYGGNTASTLLGNWGNGAIWQSEAANAINAANHANWQAWAASQSVNTWSTPLPRAPGIYWTRTSGKTHTVEVVR